MVLNGTGWFAACVLCFFLYAGFCFGEDIKAERIFYVNNEIGDDLNDGLAPENIPGKTGSGPFASLQKAFSSISTSDCVNVANTLKPYRGGNWVSTAGGTTERPMVIDGHGAVISGLGPVPADKWKKIRDNIYETDFWPMSNYLKGYRETNCWIGVPQIWWLNGKPGKNCVDEEGLLKTEGGFFWNKALKKLWFHAPRGVSIERLDVQIPVHGTAIDVTRDFVVVKNFRSMFSWNDGFDVHGSAKNVVFRNCIATDNCGQGFSCHGTSSALYEDCLAERCASSGSCDVNDCVSVYRRCVFVNNSFEAGVYAAERSQHIYESCLVAGNMPFEQIWQKGFSGMRFINCLIVGAPGNTNGACALGQGSLFFSRCTFANLPFVCRVGSEGSFMAQNCVISDCREFIFSSPLSAFQSSRMLCEGNIYWRSPGMVLDNRLYGAEEFDEYRRAAKGDARSRWASPLLGGFLGAEPLPGSCLIQTNGPPAGAILPQCVKELYLATRNRYPLPDGSFTTNGYFSADN